MFTTPAGTITVVLANNNVNPTSAIQAISGLGFAISDGATSGTLASSSGQQVTVNSNGSFTPGLTAVTGWGLNSNVNGGIQLDALGFVGPAGLILGAPNSSNIYSKANGSIAGNGPHNPFIFETATLSAANVTAQDTITGADFYFGTTDGTKLSGVVTDTAKVASTPEPASLALFGLGAIAVGTLSRRKA